LKATVWKIDLLAERVFEHDLHLDARYGWYLVRVRVEETVQVGDDLGSNEGLLLDASGGGIADANLLDNSLQALGDTGGRK
jgi:hypothetical protein